MLLRRPRKQKRIALAKFSYAANRLKKGVNFKVWKDGFHLIILDNHLTVVQRVNYIHYNPVALDRVYHESDWKNSSYAAYEEGNREIPAVKLNPSW